MPQFNRTASVSVGPAGQQGIELSRNRIAFRVYKDVTGDSNEASVEVYNLSKDSEARFQETENTVVLRAGYGNETSIIAVGDISATQVRNQYPDIVTEVSIGDGLRALRDTRVSLSYRGGVSARSIIADIRSALEVDNRPTDADLSGTYRQGYSFTGRAREALDDVTARFGLSWSIQNGGLQIATRGEPVKGTAPLISPGTGMLGSPQRKDSLGSDLSAAKKRPGLIVRSLLLPRIEPESRVIIESRDVDRTEYRVLTVEHNGDTRGSDWTTQLEVVEA